MDISLNDDSSFFFLGQDDSNFDTSHFEKLTPIKHINPQPLLMAMAIVK